MHVEHLRCGTGGVQQRVVLLAERVGQVALQRARRGEAQDVDLGGPVCGSQAALERGAVRAAFEDAVAAVVEGRR
jgi:hypothetical protein